MSWFATYHKTMKEVQHKFVKSSFHQRLWMWMKHFLVQMASQETQNKRDGFETPLPFIMSLGCIKIWWYPACGPCFVKNVHGAIIRCSTCPFFYVACHKERYFFEVCWLLCLKCWHHQRHVYLSLMNYMMSCM